MFSYLLHDSRKLELLRISRLLHVFELPLLWDGKTEFELTGNTDLNNVEFELSETQKMSWKNIVQAYYLSTDVDAESYKFTMVDDDLLTVIKAMPLISQNNKEKRLIAAQEVLKENILNKSNNIFFQLFSKSSEVKDEEDVDSEQAKYKEKKEKLKNLQQSRIVIFELMRTNLNYGEITDSKRNLLQILSMIYRIDGESFYELYAQANALQKEIKRSINLIME